MIHGEWKNCVIAASGQTSAEVDLGRQYSTIMVVMPTITTAQITPMGAEKSGGTFQNLYLMSPSDGANKLIATTSGTGALTCVLPIGGFRFIKLYSSAVQGSERTFRVCGLRP